MGADQSTASIGQLKSQRDEDIPYTSYSISKPIDSDTPKASPRISSKVKSASKDSSAKDGAGPSGSSRHSIVVVAEGSAKTRSDSELVKLEEVPVFLPLVKASLNLPPGSVVNQMDAETLNKLDSEQILMLCQRYQEHLKQCSEAVAFDQNALCVRIKEVDFAIQTLYSNLTERQKKFSKYAEQIQKVGEVKTCLKKIRMNIDQTLPLMEKLNSVLHPGDQLEHFQVKQQK